MKTRHRGFWVAMLAAAVMAGPAGATTLYSVTELTLGGGYGDARGINDLGQVAGSSTLASGEGHAFLYSNGVTQDLGTLPGGSYSEAFGINNAGQVVGFASVPGDDTGHAFLYGGSGLQDLGSLAGPYSYAYAINDQGEIVGTADTARFGGAYKSTIYGAGGIQTTFGLGVFSAANAVNNHGVVVGEDEFGGPNGAYGAYVYSQGVETSLTSLIDPASGWTLAEADDINDAGQVVGYGYVGGVAKGYVYANGQVTGIPDLAEDIEPTAINAGGAVVGADFFNDGPHAFLYDDATTVDLNSLINPRSGWVLRTAEDINASGQIVGQGLIDGQQQAFLLTPLPPGSTFAVPEPATWAMMLTGLAMLGGALRRRRSALQLG